MTSVKSVLKLQSCKLDTVAVQSDTHNYSSLGSCCYITNIVIRSLSNRPHARYCHCAQVQNRPPAESQRGSSAASNLSNKLVTFQKHQTFKKGISQHTSVGSHYQTRLREYSFNRCWCGWDAEDPLKIGSQLSVSCVKRSAGRVIYEILETETRTFETETTSFETKTETRTLETETIKKTSRDRNRSRDFNIPGFQTVDLTVLI